MSSKFRDFVRKMAEVDYTDYQEQIIREYEQIGDSTLYGGKLCGSDAEHRGSEYIAQKLREIGVDKVELVPVKTDRCQFNDATLTFLDGGSDKVFKPYGAITTGTDKEGITSEIVDAGFGTKDEFEGLDVEGKIVLLGSSIIIADTAPVVSVSIAEARNRGAKAVITYTEGLDRDTHTAIFNNAVTEIPVLSVSVEEAEYIKGYKGKVNLTVDAEVIPDGGVTYEVVGEITGTESDERIIYTSHLDHYYRCIQDNMTSVVSLLGIAKAMVDLGYRPKRTITFIFSGSHETGHTNSTSPDLKGPYELLFNAKPEIAEKAVANINFEYTGMRQEELRSLVSYEAENSYLDFLNYMPRDVKGFGKVAEDVRSGDYYLLTWCDALISLLCGIPVYMNDAIGDQIYTGTSPYMGRDHSDKDTWDIFSREAMKDTTFWYACMAAYVDSKALVQLDFSKRMDFMDFTEDEHRVLSEAGVDTSGMQEAIEAVRTEGKQLYKEIYRYNMGERELNQETDAINRALLDINKELGLYTDNMAAIIITMLGPLHKWYMMNVMMISAAQQALRDGKLEDAVKSLCYVDIAKVSYNFDEEMAELFKEMIEGKNATWTKGRVGKCFTLADIMKELKEKEKTGDTDFAAVLGMLDAAKVEMLGLVEDQIGKVTDAFNGISRKIADCSRRISGKDAEEVIADSAFSSEEDFLKWMKGFTRLPHRMTGTPEGTESAEYVKRTFEEIGLEDVCIEEVDSLSMDMKEYELTVQGEKVPAFFANCTNRGGKYGDFIAGADGKEKEIVYLKTGAESDYEGVDVKGKIVLCDVYFFEGNPADPMDWSDDIQLYDPEGRINKSIKKYDIYSPNNWPYNYYRAMDAEAAGFVGIVHNFMDEHYYHEDYSVSVPRKDGKYLDLPAMWVSHETGEKLKSEILGGKSLTGLIRMETEYKKVKAKNVIGVLRGKSDDVIMVHSHHDAVCEGAVQDASGMSEIFAIARYFAAIPAEKREKTLIFGAMDSHYTDYEGHEKFILKRQKEGVKILLDVVIEHVAKEMDIDENNNMIVNDEPEVRILYVSKKLGMLEKVKDALMRNDLDKTIIVPVDEMSGDGYVVGGVCSDATVSWYMGYPVISLIATPMYLYHDSDKMDKVHMGSMVPIGKTFSEIVLDAMNTL